MGVGQMNLEPVVFRVPSKLSVSAGFLEGYSRFFVEDIANALIKEQWEYELLIVASVDSAAQQRGSSPQIGFELLLRDTVTHLRIPSRWRKSASLSSAANAASALSLSRCIASPSVIASCTTSGST
jgi:hypothetical protein